MPSLDHIHTYARRKGSKKIFICLHPDCSHQQHATLLINKRSLCARCKQTEIILNYESLRRAEPRCLLCQNTEEARAYKTKLKVLQEMGLGV